MLLSIDMYDLFVRCEIILVDYHWTGATLKESGKHKLKMLNSRANMHTTYLLI